MTALTATASPARRNTEAGLMALAGIVIGVAFVLSSLGRSDAVPANLTSFVVAILALFTCAHIGVRKLAPRADPLLVPLAVMLNGIGYVFIARLNDRLAAQQAGWTAVGIFSFLVTLAVVRRVRTLERVRYTVGLIGVLLLIMPLIPGIGVRINGARIWVRLGVISFQPGEFAKIALAVFFAAYLVERRELLGTATFKFGPIMTPDPKHLLPVLVAWGFSLVVMMFQKDLGSALLFFMLFMSVLWIATERASYLAVGMGLFGGGAYLSWTLFSHVQDRVSMWLNPWQDAQGKGYQIIQSTYAFAWGGVAGTGLGQGLANRVPIAESDFIFAIIGEELGLLGATAILVLFLLLVGSGLRIAMAATDPFSKLLAAGLTTLIGVQSFIIMAGVTRLLPLTGLTLPFVSYGGSSLISNWVLVALLVRLSDETAEAADRNRPDDATTVIKLS